MITFVMQAVQCNFIWEPSKLWSLLMGRKMLTNCDMWHVTLKHCLWFGHGDKTLNCVAGPQSAAVKCSVCTRNDINWQASTQHRPNGKQTMHMCPQCNNDELCLLLCGLTGMASLSRHIISYCVMLDGKYISVPFVLLKLQCGIVWGLLQYARLCFNDQVSPPASPYCTKCYHSREFVCPLANANLGDSPVTLQSETVLHRPLCHTSMTHNYSAPRPLHLYRVRLMCPLDLSLMVKLKPRRLPPTQLGMW